MALYRRVESRVVERRLETADCGECAGNIPRCMSHRFRKGARSRNFVFRSAKKFKTNVERRRRPKWRWKHFLNSSAKKSPPNRQLTRQKYCSHVDSRRAFSEIGELFQQNGRFVWKSFDQWTIPCPSVYIHMFMMLTTHFFSAFISCLMWDFFPSHFVLTLGWLVCGRCGWCCVVGREREKNRLNSKQRTFYSVRIWVSLCSSILNHDKHICWLSHLSRLSQEGKKHNSAELSLQSMSEKQESNDRQGFLERELLLI